MERCCMTEQGFSLIELITVMMILGILAVIVVPRFIQLDQDAKQQNTNSVAAALSVVSSDNYRLYKIGSADAQLISNCTRFGEDEVMPSYQKLPSIESGATYTILSQSLPAGGNAICTVHYPEDSSTTATFVGYAVP